MGIILRYRKGSYDEVLQSFLRGKSLSRKELFELREKEGSPISHIPKKRLYSRLRQLEKYGIIKHVPDQYKIVEEVYEANYDVVKDCIEVINKIDEKERVVLDRLKQLKMISWKKRIAHLPNVLKTLNEFLLNPKFFNNPSIFQELNQLLVNILRLERKYQLPTSKRIIDEITGVILTKVIELVKQTPYFPHSSTYLFLVEARNMRAIDTLFDKIQSTKPDQDQYEGVANSLKQIYPEINRIINARIDAFIRTEDEILQKIGSDMRVKITESW